MIKNIILAFALLQCYSVHLFSQNEASKLHKVSFNEAAFDIHISSDSSGIYIHGASVCDSFQRCEFILALDLFGNVTHLETFDSINALGFQAYLISDTVIYFLAKDAFNPDSSVFIYRFHENVEFNWTFDSKWEYSLAGNQMIERSLVQLKNGNLLVSTFWDQNETGFWLMCIDTSNGIVIWDTIINNTPEFRRFQFLRTESANDGGALLQGSYTKLPSREPDFFVWKMDPDGKVIWNEKFPTSIFSAAVDDHIGIAENDQNEIVFAHQELRKAQVSKLSADGAILWTLTFDQNNDSALDDFKYISKLSFTANGDIIGVGNDRLYDPIFSYAGWMFRISADGELLWERRYTHYVSEYEKEDGREVGYLSDVIELPDGDIMAVGSNNDTLLFEGQIYNDFDAWVLRVDEDGCLFPDCADDDDQLYTGVINIPDSKLTFAYKLFPNPTSDLLYIDFAEICKECRFEIYAPDGQILQKIESIDQMHYVFHTSSWSTGIHPWIIRYKSEVIENGKVVVVK